MSDYENVNMTPDYENVKPNYTPTTEEVRLAAGDILCRNPNHPGEACDGDLQFTRWLAEHDREQRAIGWDERDNAKPSYLGPDNGHYLDDCGGYEDCFCASYPNPYREVSK